MLPSRVVVRPYAWSAAGTEWWNQSRRWRSGGMAIVGEDDEAVVDEPDGDADEGGSVGSEEGSEEEVLLGESSLARRTPV